MTTIKSTLRGSRAQLVINESDPADKLAVGETSLMVITGTGAGHLVHVPTADLAAALGLVTREAHREQVAAVQKERDEWKGRAEEAEATIARIKARVDASPSQWIKHELQACLDNRKSVILTATIEGLRVGNASFIKGTLASIQTADADRLISAGLAKEADQ
ncbi:hypothetical protein SCMU_14040 [Sinomonas cyclohexanicum]|uniref:Uncharacterized protein n=1 Tax=Sinomonas cyclohexanicum TaxID=322009 RepID=A0ABN6FF79_SINCY|nr:hypothetical protein [Corynebacterium cyclohexanicum]BCT75562.1 hypothetical protein SCMU_14040 [Corynebacterium cyclohexanicum]